MTAFSEQIRAVGENMASRTRRVFANAVGAAHDSVTNGSAVTGAPGQPVDTGTLRASWQVEFDGPDQARIQTNVVYAPFVEDGISARGTPLTLRSAVGGWHSAKLTAAGWGRLLELAAEQEAARA